MKSLFCAVVFCAISVHAEAFVASNGLAVEVLPPKIAGQKAIVELKLKNNLTNAVELARAICFLMDEQGKMVGHSTKWVIGYNHTSLEPKAETSFNFVINSSQPFTTTNLTAQVSFSRVVLAGDKPANPNKDVIIINQSR